jgi:hypothetical protein
MRRPCLRVDVVLKRHEHSFFEIQRLIAVRPVLQALKQAQVQLRVEVKHILWSSDWLEVLERIFPFHRACFGQFPYFFGYCCQLMFVQLDPRSLPLTTMKLSSSEAAATSLPLPLLPPATSLPLPLLPPATSLPWTPSASTKMSSASGSTLHN